jgi:transposase
MSNLREQRTLEPLKDIEYSTLKEMMRYHPTPNLRQRSHAVLLSAKGYFIDELSDIFEVDRDTISSWLTRWQTKGLWGLYDEQKSGRPPIVNNKGTSDIKKIVLENPRSLKTVLAEVKKN